RAEAAGLQAEGEGGRSDRAREDERLFERVALRLVGHVDVGQGAGVRGGGSAGGKRAARPGEGEADRTATTVHRDWRAERGGQDRDEQAQQERKRHEDADRPGG